MRYERHQPNPHLTIEIWYPGEPDPDEADQIMGSRILIGCSLFAIALAALISAGVL